MIIQRNNYNVEWWSDLQLKQVCKQLQLTVTYIYIFTTSIFEIQVPSVSHLDHIVPCPWTFSPQISDASQRLNKKGKKKRVWLKENRSKKMCSYILQSYFLLPDLAPSVNELSSSGSFFTKLWEVDVSACSQARDRFSNVSPSSWPHYKYIS